LCAARWQKTTLLGNRSGAPHHNLDIARIPRDGVASAGRSVFPDPMNEVMYRTIDDLLGPLEFDPHALKRKYVIERDKRIVPEGNQQYAPAIDGRFADFGKDPWVDPDFSRPPIVDHTEVVVAGGGFGGLLVGARLREAGFSDIRIIEEGGDFGGTWYWNRYPGAMCDIEAHIYLPLLEELNYAPRHRYAYAPEMLEHSRRIGEHYGLYDKACFQTVITSARWIEADGVWLIETNRGDRMTARYFALACGRQSLPKLPGIPGIDVFEGHAFHSSRWDYRYTGGDSTGNLVGLRDKHVAVIGTGATAVQIVPEVARWAEQLVVFQRTPSSVGVRGQQPTGPDWADMSKPGWQKERRENFQRLISNIRQELDYVHDGWIEISAMLKPMSSRTVAERLGRRPTQAEIGFLAEVADYRAMNYLRARVEQVVKDPTTAEALKPWYRWFCKRPCFHDDYLQAFNRPNVTLVDTQGQGVERLTRRGLVAGGREYRTDCIIFATGFEAGISYSRLIGFEIEGTGGRRLSEHWRGGVRTLHGMTTDGFPNCLLVGGNQQTAAAVNAVHLLDEQSRHLAYILSETRRRGAVRLEPSTEAVDGFVDVVRSSPKNKPQVEYYRACTPGYYNGEGKATRSDELFVGGRYPDGPMPFYEMLAAWRSDGKLEGLRLG
jgi:cyclohexanone monooxygenase